MLADEKTSEEKPKRKLEINVDVKLILIGLVIFLVAMGGSYFLMKSLMAPLLPKEESQQHELTGNLVEVGEFTTNINDVNEPRFLRFKVAVEVASEKDKEKITEFLPVIKDGILGIVASKTVADLDVRNRANLKTEIKKDLNKKIGGDTIRNIYFTDFIMQ